MLINAYCTHRRPPELDFPHEFVNRRDRSDPELAEHLDDFVGFVLDCGRREMTQSLYHVMRHIERVQNQLSLWVDDENLDAFADWAMRANAICFLPDSTVRDPAGRVLVGPGDGTAEEGADVPYPADARERRSRTRRRLADLGVETPTTLPPTIGEDEVSLRPAGDVARRGVALCAVALRAESLATGDEIPVDDLRERLPLAFDAISERERSFLDDPEPERQTIFNFAWQYEALFLLEWALGLIDDLPLPTAICDVPLVAKLVFETPGDDWVQRATLRSTAEILDALDLHFRLHWAVRQARLDESAPPAKLNPGVIFERHRTLNWLVRFENAEWDDVDTPT